MAKTKVTKKSVKETEKKKVAKKQPKTTKKVVKTETKKLTSKKLAEIKQTAPENMSKSDFSELQKKELEKLSSVHDREIELLIENTKLKQRVEVLQVKYRTKYMEAEHIRKQTRNTKDKILDIISDLKIELMKYAPNDKVMEIQARISEITSENNVGRKRSI